MKIYINLPSKGKYIRLCQVDPIGAGNFVAITGPPDMKEIIVTVYQLSFFLQTVQRDRQCVKVLCEYTFYQVLYYRIENSIIITKQCKNK